MKKERINKHPDWQMSRSEKNWYYLGDISRLFCSSLVAGYMTMFLMFQGVNMASLATAMLIVKIIDSVDDVLFGFIIDKINIAEWKIFRKLAGKGKYMPWYRLFFWTFPVATILFFMMPKNSPDSVKIAWFFVTYLLYDFTCTLTEVPMQSMITTLTDSPSERNSILTVKGVISVVAAIGMSILVSALLSENVGVPLKDIGICGALIFLVFMLPMVFKVHEHNTELKNVEKEGSQEQYTFRHFLFPPVLYQQGAQRRCWLHYAVHSGPGRLEGSGGRQLCGPGSPGRDPVRPGAGYPVDAGLSDPCHWLCHRRCAAVRFLQPERQGCRADGTVQRR